MTTQITETVQLLTVKEVAEMLRKTEASLRWMIHSGTAPKSGILGGRRMFRLSDVENYIEEAFSAADD
ncbi:MAG: helix-turn-helix domain-containing protein [Leucobacter sp.]